MRKFSFICLLWCITHSLLAQQGAEAPDSLQVPRQVLPGDSLYQSEGKTVVPIKSYAQRFNPRKAILFAAVMPGLGQVYNKKYWKVPIVYGGFGAGVYLISTYQNIFEKYKNELFELLESGADKSPSGFTEKQLRDITTKSKRERDFFTIITGFWYILQLVDAHVDAHLKEFDLNPQLKMTFEPTLKNDWATGRTTGFTLKFKF